MKTEYVVYNQRLAGFLMMNGFPLKHMSESNTGSNKNVFFFNKSDELFKKIKEFKEHFQ
jgi:hypothetical protein